MRAVFLCIRLDGIETNLSHCLGKRVAGPDPSTICWVASYPRSGNTWLRFLISGLFKDESVSSADLETFVPDIHGLGRKGTVNIYNPIEGTCFIKTHWMFDPGRDVFSAENSCIYILRNPLDVLTSHLNYVRFPDESLKEEFIETFIARGGAPQWFPHLMGSWSENAQSWIDGPERSLFLIYEDFLRDPVPELARLAEFVGREADEQDLKSLMASFSFDAMQQREQDEREQGADGLFGDFSVTRDTETKFVQTGQAGHFRDLLPPALVEKGLQVFEPQMHDIERRLGRRIDSWQTFNEF